MSIARKKRHIKNTNRIKEELFELNNMNKTPTIDLMIEIVKHMDFLASWIQETEDRTGDSLTGIKHWLRWRLGQ